MTTETITNHDAFATAYADAVIPDMTDDQWQEASKVRNLLWRGERMPLTEAAILYEAIVDGYNEFKPLMLTELKSVFDGKGIEVTPAREHSVCVYLWIPDEIKAEVLIWIVNNWNADEMDMQKDGSLRVWWD